MLHCSSCGGKLREKSRKCDYCGSEMTWGERNMGPACPECFARLPGGARFCSECGVKISPEAIRTTRATASCPRCKGQLALREFPKGHYTECLVCGGIWLDAQAFESVIKEKDEGALAGLIRSAEATANAGAAETIKYVPCPTCGSMMNRKNFAECSGIVIDICKNHGLWFDHRELEKILSFVRAGGLDKARKMGIERAKAELAQIESRKRAAALVGPAVWSAGSKQGGGWSASRGSVGDLTGSILDLAGGLLDWLK
jgi:Zn-finger nucleic acid-binding protein